MTIRKAAWASSASPASLVLRQPRPLGRVHTAIRVERQAERWGQVGVCMISCTKCRGSRASKRSTASGTTYTLPFRIRGFLLSRCNTLTPRHLRLSNLSELCDYRSRPRGPNTLYDHHQHTRIPKQREYPEGNENKESSGHVE